MLRIGLLGMSGVGKTHWSRQLAAHGFQYFGCDDMIASKLQARDGKPFRDLYDVGRWMGLPYERGFQEKEELYLSLERETLLDVAETFSREEGAAPVVVDLTGSAVYASETVLARLRQSLVLVYLALTPEAYEQMLKAYLQRPRPLIWRGLYARAPGQTRMAAFRESYPRLISHREGLYERYGDVRLDYALHRREGMTVEDFVLEIGARLAHAGPVHTAENVKSKRRLDG